MMNTNKWQSQSGRMIKTAEELLDNTGGGQDSGTPRADGSPVISTSHSIAFISTLDRIEILEILTIQGDGNSAPCHGIS